MREVFLALVPNWLVLKNSTSIKVNQGCWFKRHYAPSAINSALIFGLMAIVYDG